MSLQVNDPRLRGRSKSPSGSIRDRSKSRDSRRPSPSPSRSPAAKNTVRWSRELDSPDEDLRPRSRDTKSRTDKPRYDLSDSDDNTRKRRYRQSDSTQLKGRYYHSDTDEEDGKPRGKLTPGYVSRTARTSHSPRPSVYDDYSQGSGSDDSLDEGLVYGHDHLSPSPRSSSTRHSRRRSSSRLRGSDDEDVPGSHPSYATPGRYGYADPAQYAYANPGATRLAGYPGVPMSTAARSNWAPVPECEMPGYAPPPDGQGPSIPGSFPLEGSAAQSYASTASQYRDRPQHQAQSGRPVPIPASYGYAPSASASSHQRTPSGNAGSRQMYANLAPFQYAQIEPNVKYGSKTSAVPYAYSTTPQFSKPSTSEQQYVEIAPGKRPSKHSRKPSSSSANTLSVGGPELGRRPASPMLEPYKGTYQSISPMPSPIMPSSKLDEDISDVEALDAPSDAGRRKKDKRKSKEDKESKGKVDRSKRDRSSTRQGKNDSQDQQAMVLVTPTSSGKRVSFYDPVPDALEMRDALSHTRNIDTKPLIYILPHLASEDILTLRKEYKNHVKIQGKGINMAKHLRLKLGASAFGKVCYATALGRWESEAYWANCYYQSSTSRRELLIESLTGRSNTEIGHIKESFRDSRYADSLERCMKAELKADKFRTAILLALEERRQSERGPIDSDLVREDVRELHGALTSREGGETAMIHTIVLRSDNHLREVLRTYEKRYQRNFARDMIAKSQNLVGETLAHILNGVINRPMRDALLLHQALRESRTGKERSELLISRLVRLHWEPRHLEMVKLEFQKRYGELLEEAIAEEVLSTAGGSDWGEFCIELARSSVSEG